MVRPTRRVVTGHDQAGRSIVLSDGEPPQFHSRQGGPADFIEIWNTGGVLAPIRAVEPAEPNDRGTDLGPGGPGTVIRFIDVRPISAGGTRTPMHRTATIDYAIVLEGEIVLILDEDKEVVLKAGEVVVQRGTDHAWENRSGAITRMAFIHVGGEFDGELKARLPAMKLTP
jgi:mannose-6-phosphate isomerase-like protein (cupin superfamily)